MPPKRSRIDWEQVRARLEASRAHFDGAERVDEARRERVLAARAARLAARKRDAPETAPIPVLQLRLGAEGYALALADLAGVQRLDGWSPVPDAPPGLLGITVLRGEIGTLADLAALLGVPSTQAAAGDAGLVLRDGGGRLLLRVEAIEALRDLRPEELRPSEGSGPRAGWVRGRTAEPVTLLDGPALARAVLGETGE